MRRGVIKAGVGSLAVVAGAASVAWGCASVTSPYLNALEPNRGEVPASVVVSGGNWVPNQNLNLVWAKTGQSLGSAQTSGNGSFSARVTIPAEAEIGKDYVDYVRAVQGTTVGNTPFGVDSPAEDTAFTVPPPAPVTHKSVSGGDPNRTTQTTAVEEKSTTPAPAGGSGGIPSRPAQGDGTTTADAAGPATVANADGSTSPVPARTTAAAGAQRSKPAAAVPSSPLNPTSLNNTGVTPAPATEEEEAAAVDARTASPDLWSGFATGPGTIGSPSLTTLPTTTDGTSSLAIAMGVLSGGLVALFAGFGVADLRRRRVTVTSDNG